MCKRDFTSCKKNKSVAIGKFCKLYLWTGVVEGNPFSQFVSYLFTAINLPRSVSTMRIDIIGVLCLSYTMCTSTLCLDL